MATNPVPGLEPASVSAVPFACPQDGVVTLARYADGRTRRTAWQGADPDDPFVCLGSTGETVIKYIYGVQGFPLLAGRKDLEEALARAFAGAAERSCAEIKSAVGRGGVGYFYAYDCWRQLGRASVTINGANVPVIVFQESYEGIADNSYAYDFTFYYDTRLSLFVGVDPVTRRMGKGGLRAVAWRRTVVSEGNEY